MRKLIILLILVLGTIGAYALSGLLPDTGVFPRIPIGTGSIGSILAKVLGTTSFELSNGRVNNTLFFSWISGSGYLHIGNCSNASEVWIGLDAGGNPVCGAQKPLLVFGNIETTSWTVTVIRYQDGSNIIASAWLPLYAGDIVITDPASEAEIGFPSDNSILRLDENTNVELQFGTLGWATVAQAILNNGNLWGRVLTGTGINFGGGWYIAGVRGTSISQSTHPGMSMNFSVVHSLNTDAVTYSNLNTASSYPTWTGQSLYIMMYTWSQDGIQTAVDYPPLQQPTEFFYSSWSPWIRENTKRDIVYLKSLADSGALTTAERTLAADELRATRPTILWGNECQNLLSGPVADSPSQQGSWDIDSTVRNIVCSNTITDDTLACGVQGKLFWNNLVGKNIDVCQNLNIIAVADFVNEVYRPSVDRLVSPLRWSGSYFSVDQAASHGNITAQWLEITASGKWLEYVVGWLNLAGKTIKIELDNPIPLIPTSTKYYVIDFWASAMLAVYKKAWSYYCWWGVCGTNVTESPDKKTVTIKLPISPLPTQMIIGNTPAWTPSYSSPIWATIKKISISN